MDNIEEQLSRMMDDDLPPAEKDALVEHLLQDAEAQDIWERYHLIRNALNNTMNPGDSILKGVRAVVDKEDLYNKAKVAK